MCGKTCEFDLFVPESRFTDDSVLTVAVADVLMTGAAYVEKLREYTLAYPDRGFGAGFWRWVQSGSHAPYNSWGNGAAMRVSPVGFAFDTLEAVLREAEKSAAVTHNHPEGIRGAQATAAAIFLARQGETKEQIRATIRSRFAYDLRLTVDEIRPTYTFNDSCQGIAFTLYPMLASFINGFTEYHIRQPTLWVGLQNYIELFQDKLFWKALCNTLYMVIIGVPLTLLFSFICAVALNLKVRGQSFYRVIYFLPSIVPIVASTMLWLWILNPSSGLFNTLLNTFGIEGPNWFRDPSWSKSALILLALWGVGGTIVIYLSGLQDVPQHLVEAAELDGASWGQRLRHITIPMVSPITLFNLIIGVIAMFQDFSQAYVFGAAVATTGNAMGAPLNSTWFYSVYLYQTGFRYLKIGYASAMAWISFLIILGCTILILRSSYRWTYYAG